MTHYFGMYSAKQIMRNKGTQFGYKKFVLTSWDGYPYHKIPYCVAKGIAETPEKDLTSWDVIEFILEMKNTEANVAFDNWYALTKLKSLLNAVKMPTICTERVDCVGTVPWYVQSKWQERNGALLVIPVIKRLSYILRFGWATALWQLFQIVQGQTPLKTLIDLQDMNNIRFKLDEPIWLKYTTKPWCYWSTS